MKTVLAVVVLYRMAIEESPVCSVLRQALTQNPLFAQTVDLLLIDNSPRGSSCRPACKQPTCMTAGILALPRATTMRLNAP